MEMLASDAIPARIPKDTIKKDTNSKPALPNLPAAPQKINKDSALLPNKKKIIKNKVVLKKQPTKKKKTKNNNVNQL
jgi:hypothetical protein